VPSLCSGDAFPTQKFRLGRAISFSSIQAATRSQVALAAKGNGPAQRALIAAVDEMDRKIAAEAAEREKAATETPQYTDLEAARRLAYFPRSGVRATTTEFSPVVRRGDDII
jgi:hypothetical protein